MGIFDRLMRREITPEVDDVLLQAILNGQRITREKALTLPAVSSAVDFISNSVACMPVKLYRTIKGKVEEVKGDTRTALLNGDTGDTLNAFQLKKAMVQDYLLGKGGYAYIQRQRNDVTGIYYVSDQDVTIFKTTDKIKKNFVIQVDAVQYRRFDFIKLLRNTKDGASGTGLTDEVGKALETAYQTMLFQLSLVRSGGGKKGFLKSARKLGQEEIDTLKRAWQNLYSTDEENVVVLNNGLEFQEAASSSTELQLNESKRTLDDQIRAIFHIKNNFDETFKEAIYPVVKSFDAALNTDLLLEKEKRNYFFALDVKEIIRANLKERYEAYRLAKETGFITINEIRQEENMNWIEGLDVVNVGLSAVLYDINTHTYFTPNTGAASTVDPETGGSTVVTEGGQTPDPSPEPEGGAVS